MTGDPRDRDEATPADLADEVSAWAAKLTATPGTEPDPEEAAAADPVATTDPGEPDPADLDPADIPEAAATEPAEPDSADISETTETRTAAAAPEADANAPDAAGPEPAEAPDSDAGTDADSGDGAGEPWAGAVDLDVATDAGPASAVADLDPVDTLEADLFAADADSAAGHSDTETAATEGSASGTSAVAQGPDSAAEADPETQVAALDAAGPEPAEAPDSDAGSDEGAGEPWATAGTGAAATNGSGPLPASASPAAEAAAHAAPATDGTEHHADAAHATDQAAEPTDGAEHHADADRRDAAPATDEAAGPTGAPATDGTEHHADADRPDAAPATDAAHATDQVGDEPTEAATTERDPVPDLGAALEAVLMVVDEPIPTVQLAQVLETPRVEVEATLHRLAEEYTAAGRGFDLREVAGGWRFYSRPECAPVVERFILDGQQARLTQAALETLAVIAYRQPVSRTRVSAIRGVNCDGVVRTLVSRGLIEEAGTEQESNATLYRTTTLFLERLGLQSVDELPDIAPYLPEVDELDSEDVAG